MGLKQLTTGLLATFLFGCGVAPQTDYGKLGLVDVTGVVTLDGSALPYAVVTFENPETGQFSYGQTNDSGHYQMQLDSEMAGVVPGEKLVRISTTKKVLGLNTAEEGGSSEGGEEEGEGDAEPSTDARTHELVPARYNKESELKVTVSDSEKTFDFELKSE